VKYLVIKLYLDQSCMGLGLK